MQTKHGLVVFDRERIGLRKPAGPTSRQDRITRASIHHGGEVGPARMSFDKMQETWKQWQAFHINSRGWSDIGYQFGVDGKGRLYEGRSVHTVPAAVAGWNTGSVGIVFAQDGTRYGLTKAQRNTLRVLFEHGISELDLPPLKRLEVRTHRECPQHESNTCPGQKIQRHVAWRRGEY